MSQCKDCGKPRNGSRDRCECGGSELLPASKAISAAPERERQDTSEPGKQTAQADTQDSQQSGTQEMGNVPPMSPAETGTNESPRDADSVIARFMAEGRWFGKLSKERDEMYRLAKKQKGMTKPKALAWVYGELNRMYPPIVNTENILNKQGSNSPGNTDEVVNNFSAIAENPRSDDGSIQGLGTIPEGWPELPANASLAVEVAWVQANRLRIVREQLGKATVVDLGKALSPAPSWAALGWLETSIRSYAKFVDVAAKASGGDDGEQGVMKRERMAIEEVRDLLAEMRADRSGK